MDKLWKGRTSGATDAAAESFNSSIGFDSRLYKEDITGSMAHASMLCKCGIITEAEAEQIKNGLLSILEDIESGKLAIDMRAEDIHTFVEATLTEKIGEPGKKLHTARSRNDQVALDTRMYLREAIKGIAAGLKKLIGVITGKAEIYKGAVMPGYTHLQRAQPVTFGHWLMAYAMMFLRDVDRLTDCYKRVNVSPIGCCALAGTTYGTDRGYEASLLGFDGICKNSLDGVSDRDFCIEFLSCASLIMTHFSRLCEEIILYCSGEFGFITLDDGFTTGSSIMPQKKNPDPAELTRGKTGRVYGDLMSLLTVMKGLPLAYNKDMQEDKEPLFDAVDTVTACTGVVTGMIGTLTVNADKMKKAAQCGFINATDLADWLVSKGLPFRTAYKTSAEIVNYCADNGYVLETLPLEKYREFFDQADETVYEAVDIDNAVAKRTSAGGTSPDSVSEQIKYVKSLL